MQYDKEFEEWWSTQREDYRDIAKPVAYSSWQFARRDHYRIGEKVEVACGKWMLGKISAYVQEVNVHTSNANDVRRVPKWEPKEGEAVIFSAYNSEDILTAFAGVFSKGSVRSGKDTYSLVECKQFSADKIGKPWDEI